MDAGTYDIVARQGSTFHLETAFETDDGEHIDLTGYTARMQVRRSASDTDTPVLTLTTENSRIALGGTAGTVVLSVDAVTMASVPAGHYAYDVELVSGSVVTPYLNGAFEVQAEVTRG